MMPPPISSHIKETPMLMSDNDVMINILIRLPLKSLLQCKTVCKWWNNLISDSVFISNYSRQNPQYHVSGFYLQKYLFLQLYSELEFLPYEGQPDVIPKPSLAFIEDDKGVYIRDSCNGLLLCSSFRCHEEDRKYYICKPTTKQYFPLPKPPCQIVSGINIAYNPNQSPHYQVICISDPKFSSNSNCCDIKIYSSVTGSWRDSRNPRSIFNHEILFDRGVYLNGAVHWVGNGKLSMRFDVEKELIHTVSMPPTKGGWIDRKVGYFGESWGHLYLIEYYGPYTTTIDVMEMKSDYSSWSVKYHVNLHMNHRCSVLHFVHRQVGDDDDESFMVLRIPGDFVLYNFRDGTSERLRIPTFPVNKVDEKLGLWYSWEGVYPYTNPLSYL